MLKELVTLGITALLALHFSACKGEDQGAAQAGGQAADSLQTPAQGEKMLVLYFSHTGNTRAVAELICSQLEADSCGIVPARPYPREYRAVVQAAKAELDDGRWPELRPLEKDPGAYDVIFLGYPNWFGTLPLPVQAFLAAQDLAGKTIVPFCTHGGGGLGNSLRDLERLCPRATSQKAFAISGGKARDAGSEVTAWLRELGYR